MIEQMLPRILEANPRLLHLLVITFVMELFVKEESCDG
jgi:hypothetical protein